MERRNEVWFLNQRPVGASNKLEEASRNGQYL